jgi:O-methyltransferase
LNREAIYKDLYEDCYNLAQQNFAPYPGAVLVRGRVPESLSTVSINKVCYMSLDMNIAEPEVAALEFFWDELVQGAIVILDDYGWADHRPQKEALDAFASSVGVQILTLPTGQGLIIRP